MGQYDDLVDIKIDVGTGETEIDPATNDAVLIYGIDVIVQDTAIRLNAQRGEIQRQGLDTFGWERLQKIKGDVSLNNVATTSAELEKTVLVDTRIQDCKVLPGELQDDESIEYVITLEIDNAVQDPITVTV